MTAALQQVGEILLGLVYPNVCQMCKVGPARRNDGFICDPCKLGGVKPIVPPLCARCGLPFEGDITVEFQCANCHDRPLYFRSARAASEFSGVVREAIHSYKYNHAIWFEPFLVDLLANGIAREAAGEAWDCIVPIPLHWTKHLERSFNQADRLARGLSARLDIPAKGGLVRRTKRTNTQANLSRKERTENVKRAFSYCGKAPLNGERLLLIDDVLTTGATASACAKALMDNGAGVADVWTVARNLLR
jgi:ComF family protein